MGIFDKTEKTTEMKSNANQDYHSDSSFSMQPPVFQLAADPEVEENPLFQENALAGEMPEFEDDYDDEVEEQEMEEEGPSFGEKIAAKIAYKKSQRMKKLRRKAMGGGAKGKLAKTGLRILGAKNRAKKSILKAVDGNDQKRFMKRVMKNADRVSLGKKLYED